MSGFGAAATRELAYLRRSPWDLAFLTWIPLLLAGIVAWQLSPGVPRGLPVLLVDQDGPALARDLGQRLDATPGLAVVARVPDMAAAEPVLRAGRAYAAILVPRGATRDAYAGQGRVLLFFNASFPTAAALVQREAGAAIEAANRRFAGEQVAAVEPASRVRPPPVRATSVLAWNSGGSYELQLVSLLHPALMHLVFMLAVVAALGRELRDGTAGGWAPGPAALAGKAAPYVLVFLLWGVATTYYLAVARGWSVEGSALLLMGGYLAMYLGYVGVSLLIVGATRSMGQALSLTGIFAGASFAFAGAIFPIDQASSFAQWWSAILPYSYFAHLIALEWIADADAAAAMPPIAAMLLIAVVAGVPGAWLYLRAARDPASWGRR